METAGLKGNDTLRAVPQKNDFLRADFLTLVSDTPQDQREFVIRICEELQDINEVLQKARIYVGFRTRDEIVFYMLNNRRTDLLGEEDAMDYEILQKILPRIQGNRFSVGEVLCELFRKFAGDFSGMNGSSVSGQMQTYLDTQNCRYRKSTEKVCRMMRRLEEDGVVSGWR